MLLWTGVALGDLEDLPARLQRYKSFISLIFLMKFLFPADCSTRLGLPVLRGVKDPVPRCPDADPPPRGSDPTGPVAAGRLPDLQADDARSVCGQLPQLHAGRGEKSKRQRRSHKVCLKKKLFIIIFFKFSRKSLLNPEVFLHRP